MNNKFFFFDTMITPKIITFIYWLLLLADLGYGLNSMFTGYPGFTFTRFVMGLVYIVIGGVAVRIWCELLIVVFKINETLKDLNKKQ